MRAELKAGCIEWFKPILEASQPGWVAGGSVRDYFASMDCESDVDVFFPTQEAMTAAGVAWSKVKGAKKLYDNDTVQGFLYRGREVQLIKRHFFATPQQTIEQFDFTVCCCAVDLQDVYVHEHFFDDLAGRRLAINALPFPLSTLERLQRYVRRGFLACNGTLLRLARELQAVDMANPNANTLSFYPNGNPRFIRFD